MDLFDFADSNDIAEEKQAQEKSILTVSQLTRKIRNLIEYRVGEVWVEGEISNLRKQASGHQYFTLKDRAHNYHVFSSVETRPGWAWIWRMGRKYNSLAMSLFMSPEAITNS